jgi:hypothetical protein
VTDEQSGRLRDRAGLTARRRPYAIRRRLDDSDAVNSLGLKVVGYAFGFGRQTISGFSAGDTLSLDVQRVDQHETIALDEKTTAASSNRKQRVEVRIS